MIDIVAGPGGGTNTAIWGQQGPWPIVTVAVGAAGTQHQGRTPKNVRNLLD